LRRSSCGQRPPIRPAPSCGEVRPRDSPSESRPKILFAREGELLPGRAVFVEGFDDDRGTEASAARDRRGGLGGTAAPAARRLVVGRVGDGRGSGGTAALAARDLVVADACVNRLLFEGLTTALDGCGGLRAVDGRLSAPRLLAGSFVRGILPRSPARDLRLAHPVEFGGGGAQRQDGSTLFEISILHPYFP